MNTCTNLRTLRVGLVVTLAGALAACSSGSTGNGRDGAAEAAPPASDGAGGDAAFVDAPAATDTAPEVPADVVAETGPPDEGPMDVRPVEDTRPVEDVRSDVNVDVDVVVSSDAADVINEPEAGCGTGTTTCAGSEDCVDLRRDRENCGTCGRACSRSQACAGGSCICPTGLSECGDRCLDTMGDRENCGACGHACGSAQTCVRGVCACPAGQTGCGTDSAAVCVDVATDTMNCGLCGAVCATGRTCVAGACACPAGQTPCGAGAAATCVSAQSDNANCGACGNACTGGSTCTAGACVCPTGETRCGTGPTAACTNTASDGANCGACGTACPSGQLCNAGVCQVTCTAPRTRCGAGSAQVCTSTATDDQNCGACGAVCAAVANSSMAVCTAGACQPTCAAGFGNCDMAYPNGCESALTTDAMNCGACGTRCPSTAANASGVACIAGACRPACLADTATARFRDCNMMAADGCEANVQDSATNCGACGTACAAGLACVAGVCAAASCNELHTRAASLPSGVYTIDPDGAGAGAPFSAYCDMTSDGGGWTLLLKIDGRLENTTADTTSQFLYESPLWTNGTTLNTTSTDVNALSEAKFAGFATMPFARVRLVMRDFAAGGDRGISFSVASTSLQALFSGPTVNTAAGGRAAWGALVADPALQFNCNAEGINVGPLGFNARSRIGIHTNQEDECESPDSFLGVGPTNDYVNTYGAGFGRTSSGNFAAGAWSEGAYEGDRTKRTFSWVYVR